MPSLYPPGLSQPRPPRPYEIQPFDPSRPLVVMDNSPAAPWQRLNPQGIPGDVDGMLAVFDALMEVGKLDRAALILKRFARIGFLSPHDLVYLHNRYLRGRIVQIQEAQIPEDSREGNEDQGDLHKWYELEIRKNCLPHTAETIAYMLKASLLTAHGSRLERLISRYMDSLPEHQGLSDLHLGDVLTDKDLVTIANVCPQFQICEPDSEVPFNEEDPVDVDGNAIASERSATASGTPEVLATPQKGSGLRTLKQALSIFHDVPEGQDISQLSPAARREFQAKLERDSVDAAMARWREENETLVQMGHHPILSTLSFSTLGLKVSDWQDGLAKRIKEEIRLIDAAESAERKNPEDLDRCMYGPFLRLADAERIAAVTILATLNAFATAGVDRGVALVRLVNTVARYTEQDIEAQRRERDLARQKKEQRSKKKMRLKLVASGLEPLPMNEQPASPDFGLVNLVRDSACTVDTAAAQLVQKRVDAWPQVIRTKVGAFLVSALLESATIGNVKESSANTKPCQLKQPAFHHTYFFKMGKKIGLVRANRALIEIMKREPRPDLMARHLPMLVEPEPWTKFDKGGYLEHSNPLVRVRPGVQDQRLYTEAAIERGHLDQVLRGLDILGKTAWKINRQVLDVMLEAWNSEQGFANIPPLHPPIEIPKQPESTSDPLQKSKWNQSVQAAMNELAALHSQRCFMNFQLEVARAFRDQTLYFPHNVDFRGRAYPIPPYLNHMGADHARGILRFAKGKELGERGLRWLKVHLANVYGYDKADLNSREAFAMQNVENIYDSASHPLNGKRWWLEAEDPWQCLATCFELKAALDLPDPTKFVSHLPIHQDGTCNGLQHYAALGGDTWGAQQVNLEPGEAPADVYTAVANLVNEQIDKDLKRDDPFAKGMVGKIARKIVKQTVMTNVYGVTYVGAKKQVLKQLVAHYPDLEKETGISHRLFSSYVTNKIFKAMSTMFRGAHDIQTWFGEIGARVCKSVSPEQVQAMCEPEPEGPEVKKKKKSEETVEALLDQFRSTIIWTTPLRMPVVQPYRTSKSKTIHTCMQDIQLQIAGRFDPVNKRKQLQAFPPNFIHSLDASHMILTALECDDRGLDFAAVHDSFWTHAADVDTMNDVIRDAFIRIHSEDVVARLASEFEARYKDHIYLVKLDLTTEVAQMIRDFRKENRMSAKEELVQEMRRLQLLNSSDPEKVKEGKKMVTPATIYEEMSAADLVEPEDVGDIHLGGIPNAAKQEAEEGEAASIPEEFNDPELDDIAAMGAVPEPEPSMESQDSTEDAYEENKLTKFVGKNYFENAVTKAAVRKKWKNLVPVWVPMKLPPVPKKGDFDVNRLRESKYFFS